MPETLFINVTSLKAVTHLEFMYWLYCTAFTRRYGADASRIGKMRSHVVGIAGSRAEALSSLELTQRFYDVCGETNDLAALQKELDKVITASLKDIGLAHKFLNQTQTEDLLADFTAKYTSDEELKKWLIEANNEAIAYADRKAKTKPKGEEEAEETDDAGEE